jgi:HlyD family secretion protein
MDSDMHDTQKILKRCLVSVIVGASLFGLAGCKDKTNTTTVKQQVVTVKKQVTTTNLYYNGTIEPISTISATSPVDGRIAAMDFSYGQEIKKGQQLVSIDSQTLSTNFQSAVSDYLTQKNTLSTQKISYAGSQALYKAGILQRNTFLTDKSTYETTIMNFYQKKLALQKILKQVNMSPTQFENLSISDTKEVNKALSRRFKHLPVYSLGSGVALFPIPSQTNSDSNDTNGQTLIVGSSVKQGELILSVGDLSGYKVSFMVSEVDVNRLHAGLKVSVTGVSFPGVTLAGKIISVASQASSSAGGGGNIAQFQVVVEIPKVSAAAQKVIHIGMSAKVDIGIKNPPRIMLPISAVSTNKGSSVVSVQASDGTTKLVTVTTGETTLQDVAIISGLKVGQKVIVND